MSQYAGLICRSCGREASPKADATHCGGWNCFGDPGWETAFWWRGVQLLWRAPFGSQSAQYEGSVGSGGARLWFAVKQDGPCWMATCASPLGVLSTLCRRPLKEEALDEALRGAREAVAQTSQLLMQVPP